MPTVPSLPSEEQRRALFVMVAEAFVEIRALCHEGRSAQAAALADAFHNVAREVYGWGHWDVGAFRSTLAEYQASYPDRIFDFVTRVDAIFPP